MDCKTSHGEVRSDWVFMGIQSTRFDHNRKQALAPNPPDLG